MGAAGDHVDCDVASSCCLLLVLLMTLLVMLLLMVVESARGENGGGISVLFCALFADDVDEEVILLRFLRTRLAPPPCWGVDLGIAMPVSSCTHLMSRSRLIGLLSSRLAPALENSSMSVWVVLPEQP